MGPALLGIVLDSSVLIGAERRHLSPQQTIESVRRVVGDIPIVFCSITVAEIAHGIYRTDDAETRTRRRKFLDTLKATVPIYPITDYVGEIVGQVGGEQAAKGVNLPFADLLIGACALELGYAIGTANSRDFSRIPGLKIIQL